MATEALADLLACVALFGRSLDDSCDPSRFWRSSQRGNSRWIVRVENPTTLAAPIGSFEVFPVCATVVD
jgi:hypothetical protein